MMSDASKLNLDLAFRKAAGQHLVRAAGDACEIRAADGSLMAPEPGEQMLLITISSFVFRLITIFRVGGSQRVRDYYGGDSFAEVVNLCCGALNRELARSFQHIAMSIPYALSSRCFEFVSDLQPQLLSNYLITVNDAVQLQVTLCLCCSAPLSIAAASEQVEEQSGELEMF